MCIGLDLAASLLLASCCDTDRRRRQEDDMHIPLHPAPLGNGFILNPGSILHESSSWLEGIAGCLDCPTLANKSSSCTVPPVRAATVTVTPLPRKVPLQLQPDNQSASCFILLESLAHRLCPLEILPRVISGQRSRPGRSGGSNGLPPPALAALTRQGRFVKL